MHRPATEGTAVLFVRAMVDWILRVLLGVNKRPPGGLGQSDLGDGVRELSGMQSCSVGFREYSVVGGDAW